MTRGELELKLLQERNKLLAESVDLQREHLAFSRQQAAESAKRIGDYGDELLKEGLRDVLSELRSAEAQSLPEDDEIIIGHLREAIKKLTLLTTTTKAGE
jgi:predicted metal-dependent hydrolase